MDFTKTKKDIVEEFGICVNKYNEAPEEIIDFMMDRASRELINNLYTIAENIYTFILKKNNIDYDASYNFFIATEKLISEVIDSPLKNGVDLLFILRNKDARNKAIHKMTSLTYNPVPRLIQNLELLILHYIEPNITALISKKPRITGDASKIHLKDYMSLNKDYNSKKILIIDSMHDFSKEDIATINNIHWDIILDFDPFSLESGFQDAINRDEFYIMQLADAEETSKTIFRSGKKIVVNCDGQSGVEYPFTISRTERQRFVRNGNRPTNYMPANRKGAKEWASNYNFSHINGKQAKEYLKSFFKEYFSQAATDIYVCSMMEYAPSLHKEIYNVLDEVKGEYNFLKYIYVNDNYSLDLLNDSVGYEDEWFVLDCRYKEFIGGIEFVDYEQYSEESYVIPAYNEKGLATVEHTEVNYLTSFFYMLHKAFPTKLDESDFVEYIVEKESFALGNDIKWGLAVQNGYAELEVYHKLYNKIRNSVHRGETQFEIGSIPGFGGTTAGRVVSLKLKDEFPVLFMKQYDSNALKDALNLLYKISEKTIIIVIEENILGDILPKKSEIRDIARSTNVPHYFVYIQRSSVKSKSKNKSHVIEEFTSQDISKIINFNKEIGTGDKKLLKQSTSDFVDNLGLENCCPFLINLSIYKDRYIKLSDYVEEYIPMIESKKEWREIFLLVAILSEYLNRGIETKFIEKIFDFTNASLSAFVESFSTLIYIGESAQYNCYELKVRSSMFSKELLKKLLGGKEQDLLYKNNLQKEMIHIIELIKEYYNDKQYGTELLKNLFIDKRYEESAISESDSFENNRRFVSKFFSRIINDLWDQNNDKKAGAIFEALIKEYPEDPYFNAHAARYYAYTRSDFEKSREFIQRAVRLFEEDEEKASVAPDIYHIMGMCIRKELNYELHSRQKDAVCEVDKDRIYKLAIEAEEAFSETLNRSQIYNKTKTEEYALSACLILYMQILEFISKNDKENKEKEIYLEKALTSINSLENIFLLSEDEESLKDLEQKQRIIQNYMEEVATSIEKWNNYYTKYHDINDYKACIVSCRQRFHLIVKDTKFFSNEHLGGKVNKRIYKLFEDYYYSIEGLLVQDKSEIKNSDLFNLVELGILTNASVPEMMEIINGLYSITEKVNLNIDYFKYVLLFLRSYFGDRNNHYKLLDSIKYMKEKSSGHPNRIKAISFLANGTEMAGLISKKMIRANLVQDNSKIYQLEQLRRIEGELRIERGNKGNIIPYDINGKIMSEVKVFVNIEHNPYVSSMNNNSRVSFKLGFSYDGLKAENMSIRVVGKRESIRETEQSRREQKEIVIGEIYTFDYKESGYGKNSSIQTFRGLIDNQFPGIIHIKQIKPGHFVKETEMIEVRKILNRKPIQVKVLEKRGESYSLLPLDEEIDRLMK
ncbi:tetratricopeptide repeat protein [Enterococcus sp. BWM-S5]|uniref:Tetratricopeptide repeat protein n=1 Tax=Enterococcus larvae TaxID=2794352 RepID=A0ABS4CIM3_9ENTE|nr:tetratricopeptide repeat protein [Enterococcus larvae]MBP1046295.1 tetratricopeptide repeat protein [Enterococcus larvae]